MYIKIAGQTIRNPILSDELQQMQTGSGTYFFTRLLSVLAAIILIVGGVYFFFQLLTGGVAWIGSGGDKAKLEEARQKIFNAVVGLILLFSTWAIIQLVENVFGIQILQFDVPTLGQTPTSS